MTKLLTVDQVAAFCEMNEDRIYTLTREGILPAVRFGRSIRWNLEAIEQFIAEGGKGFSGGWRRDVQ